MKIGEKFIDGEGSTFHVQRTFDPNPALKAAAELRSHGVTGFGESRHVARVPGYLIAEWCKEAGIDASDHEARKELLHKKIQSGEFSALRVWEGTY